MKKFSTMASVFALATAASMSFPAATSADIQHLDDVIISLSLCVGQDCVNGESFGFDTLRLKENNLRIHFQDTSNSASFPTNDWRIVINDSSNGGANYWAIEDSNAGRQPFRVEAGARSNALYVEDDGDVGLGTSTPVVNLHIVDGNTPTLRLEQDGSSGFTPQTWDVAGNETNFFVRDATNGSRLSFRIEPSTPQDTLYLDSTGNVGFGTTSPSDIIHMSDNSGTFFGISYQNTTGTASTWRTLSDGAVDRFVISRSGNGGSELIIEPGDPVAGGTGGKTTVRGHLDVGGNVTANGTCAFPCDGVFSDQYELLSITEHSDAMWSNGFLPNVGPTLPNTPWDITDKLGRMLNELETAHIYIEQLNGRIESLESSMIESDND